MSRTEVNTVLMACCLHQVCEYLYDLSCSFSTFYDKCYCMRIDKATDEVLEINMNRMLCYARQQLECLKLDFTFLGSFRYLGCDCD